jgi:hypothetical protein
MRAVVLALLAVALAGCGGGSSADPTPAPASKAALPVREGLALDGARWIGGDGEVLEAAAVPDARAGAGVERIVAFVLPGDPASERLLSTLAATVARHPDLRVLAATSSLDAEALAALRAKTGARFPVLLGVTRATRDAWAAGPEAAVRVADASDRVVARSLVQVLARLEPAAK